MDNEMGTKIRIYHRKYQKESAGDLLASSFILLQNIWVVTENCIGLSNCLIDCIFYLHNCFWHLYSIKKSGDGFK